MSVESRSLLIVDDDTVFRERVVRAMRDRGYEVRGVPDRDAALEAARLDSPELALVDLRLQGESGLAGSCATSRHWTHRPSWSS